MVLFNLPAKRKSVQKKKSVDKKKTEPKTWNAIPVLSEGRLTGNPDSLMNAYRDMMLSVSDSGNHRELIRVYDQMMMDDRVSQVMETVNSSIKSLNWSVSASNKKVHEFITENLNALDFRSLVGKLLSARIYGYAVFEVIWEERMGYYGLRELKLLPYNRVDFVTDEYANLEAVRVNQEDIPMEWLHIYSYPELKPESYYYGSSDLKKVYREWYTKDILKRYRNLGLENFAFPIVMVSYDENRYRKGSPEWDELMSLIQGIKDDARVALPARSNPVDGNLMPGVKIEFLEPNFAGGGFEAFEKAIASENKAIARNLGLPDNLGYTDTGSGSYAKAEMEFEVFWKTVSDIAISLQGNIQKLIDRIVRMNFPSASAKFKFELSRDRGLSEEKVRVLKTLKESGIPVADAFVREYLGLADEDLAAE